MFKRMLFKIMMGVFLFAGLSSPAVADSEMVGAVKASIPAKEIERFGNDLLLKLAKKSPSGNVVLSPFSMYTLVSMAFQGASGTTKDALAKVLHMPSEKNVSQQEAINYGLGMELALSMLKEQKTVSLAHALWAGNRPFLPEYQKNMKAWYDADVTKLQGNPNSDAALINQWVAKHTNNLIKSIVSPSLLTPPVAAVLTNALYLDALWNFNIDPKKTDKAGVFHITDKLTKPIPLMNVKHKFLYKESEEENGFQFVKLPYQGGSLELQIILPPKGVSVETFMRENLKDGLFRLPGRWVEAEVDLTFPRFSTSSEANGLEQALKEMGMTIAFDSSKANFSQGFDIKRESDRVWITAVKHKAVLQIDEKGTKFAAAGAVVMTTRGMDMTLHATMKVDRPFLFFLHDNQTDTDLAAGIINDPTLP